MRPGNQAEELLHSAYDACSPISGRIHDNYLYTPAHAAISHRNRTLTKSCFLFIAKASGPTGTAGGFLYTKHKKPTVCFCTRSAVSLKFLM